MFMFMFSSALINIFCSSFLTVLPLGQYSDNALCSQLEISLTHYYSMLNILYILEDNRITITVHTT